MSENFNQQQAADWWEDAARNDPIKFITGGHCLNFEQFLGNGYLETRPVIDLIYNMRSMALGKLVLAEYGCGMGRLTFWLHQALRRAIGVDVSETMLAKAEKLMPGPKYVHCDGVSFPLKANSVDIVFSKIVFQHLPRETVRAIIADAHRVLRKGGLLIFQLPTCEDAADVKYAETPQMASRWARREIEDALADFTIELLPIGDHWGWHVARK